MPEFAPLLRLESATLIRGERLLLGPTTLELRVGERLCVTGPPSCGKSVLLEVMAGRHALSAGHRSYPAWTAWHADAALGVAPRFSTQLVSTEEQRRVTSRLASFHQARWHAQFSGPESVEMFLDCRRVANLNEFEVPPEGLIEPDYPARCATLVRQLGIASLLMRRVAALSNGEMRKVLLARAFLARPRLLLLDDPLGGLDPEARQRVVAALHEMCTCAMSEVGLESPGRAFLPRGQPLTLVIATPRPEELLPVVTRTVELEGKRVSAPSRTHFQIATHTSPRFEAAAPLEVQERAVTGIELRNSKVLHASDIDTPLIRMNRASVRVGATTILDDVSFEVRSGEHWLITGPNGSGKSTLLALLLGDHPQSYVVDLEVLGMRARPGTTRVERQRALGFMAPELALHYPPSWVARDVILSGFMATIGLYSQVTPDQHQIAAHFVRQLGLDDAAEAPLGILSEAEQRRVLLARALVRTPRLLLLDEPTQGLSGPERQRIHDLLDRVVAQSPLTLLLVSHHPDERPQCISHHLALHSGRVVGTGLLRMP